MKLWKLVLSCYYQNLQLLSICTPFTVIINSENGALGSTDSSAISRSLLHQCVHDALCINSLLAFDMTQVYDRDLTTDDFMGSASVTLSDLEIDKWVPQWEYWNECSV